LVTRTNVYSAQLVEEFPTCPEGSQYSQMDFEFLALLFTFKIIYKQIKYIN
jgi:hypothetical protein